MTSTRTGVSAALAAAFALTATLASAQVPLDRVLQRVTVPASGNTRGLVDVVGFPQTAGEMTTIGDAVEQLEKDHLAANRQRLALTDDTAFIAAWSPHDDYVTTARVYAHAMRYMKARRVILVGNGHWSETFGIRGKLIFDDFTEWRGPYGPVRVSGLREEILAALPVSSVVVNRTVHATEHSLEALVPYLQYYNRTVEIVPIVVPVMPWTDLEARAADLATAVAAVARQHGWKLGRDLAVLVSGDGQHYGDYGWSYYGYHPFGCTAEGYQKALEQDDRLVSSYLAGPVAPERLHGLFTELVNPEDVSKYRITWCGRFAVPLGIRVADLLTRAMEHRPLVGLALRGGSSLAFPWLRVPGSGLGLTSDTNLHHFVTYQAVGFK